MTPAPSALLFSLRTLLPPRLAAAPLSRISPPRLIPLALPATRPLVALRSRPTTIGRARSSATATSSCLRPTPRLTRTSALSSWVPWAIVSYSWAPIPTTRSMCTPTPPTWCSSTCCSLVRSTRSLSTTWRWRPTTVPPRFTRTRKRPPSPPRRWALSPLPPVPARPTSSSPLAST